MRIARDISVRAVINDRVCRHLARQGWNFAQIVCRHPSTQAESRKGVGGLWPSFARSIIFRRNSVTCAYASATAARHRAPGLAIRNVGKVRVKGCCSPVGHAHTEGRPVDHHVERSGSARGNFRRYLWYSCAILDFLSFQSFYLPETKDVKGLASIFHVLDKARLGKFVRIHNRSLHGINHHYFSFWDYFVYLLFIKNKTQIFSELILVFQISILLYRRSQ